MSEMNGAFFFGCDPDDGHHEVCTAFADYAGKPGCVCLDEFIKKRIALLSPAPAGRGEEPECLCDAGPGMAHLAGCPMEHPAGGGLKVNITAPPLATAGGGELKKAISQPQAIANAIKRGMVYGATPAAPAGRGETSDSAVDRAVAGRYCGSPACLGNGKHAGLTKTYGVILCPLAEHPAGGGEKVPSDAQGAHPSDDHRKSRPSEGTAPPLGTTPAVPAEPPEAEDEEESSPLTDLVVTAIGPWFVENMGHPFSMPEPGEYQEDDEYAKFCIERALEEVLEREPAEPAGREEGMEEALPCIRRKVEWPCACCRSALEALKRRVGSK